MRRILFIIVFGVLAVSLVACGSENKGEDASIEITLPASFFEEGDIDTEQIKEQGVSEVNVNDDGSVTYTMSKEKHAEILNEMENNIKDQIEEIKNDETIASIKDIMYNQSFSELTVIADQEKFENSFDGFVVFALALSAIYYQIFNGEDPNNYKVSVVYKNADSGEIFNTVVYPDDLENNE